MPIHDRHEIEVPPAHRNVRDVRAPHLVRPCDRHVPEQVREDLVLRMGTARVGTPVDRLQAHLPHQPNDSLPVDPMPLPAKHPGHLASSKDRHAQEDLVQPLHQRQILRRLTGSLVVERRAAKSQQAALPRNSEPRMVRLHHRFPSIPAHRPKARAKKSRSTVSCPIFSCSSLIRVSWDTSCRFAFPVNSDDIPSTVWRFHRLTMFGWISNRAAISDSVASSLSAAKATFALNSAEYRFRFRLLISSLLPSVESSPYPTVRKKGTTSQGPSPTARPTHL